MTTCNVKQYLAVYMMIKVSDSEIRLTPKLTAFSLDNVSLLFSVPFSFHLFLPPSLPVQVAIVSDKHTLGGMIALINSIYTNTNATVQYHLIVTRKSHEHLKKWMTDRLLRNLNFNIILFPEEWVGHTSRITRQSLRDSQTEFENPVSCRYIMCLLLL